MREASLLLALLHQRHAGTLPEPCAQPVLLTHSRRSQWSASRQPNQLDCFAAAARGIGLGIVSLGARAYAFWRYHPTVNRLHPVIN
jgi:hypothetical protein